MNFKPSDFFIGLVDFFSIMLPGFIVSFMLRDELLKLLSIDAGTKGLNLSAFYFVSSYILGHFVYAFGTILRIAFYKGTKRLFYYKFRNWYVKKIFKKKVENKTILIPTDSWEIIEHAEKIKDETHLSEVLKRRLKGFRWNKAIIEMKHPEMFQQVTRLEADAKFFRSLMIVSLIAIGISVFQSSESKIMRVAIWSFILLFSLWRYINRQYNAELAASIIIHSMGSIGELDILQETKEKK